MDPRPKWTAEDMLKMGYLDEDLQLLALYMYYQDIIINPPPTEIRPYKNAEPYLTSTRRRKEANELLIRAAYVFPVQEGETLLKVLAFRHWEIFAGKDLAILWNICQRWEIQNRRAYERTFLHEWLLDPSIGKEWVMQLKRDVVASNTFPKKMQWIWTHKPDLIDFVFDSTHPNTETDTLPTSSQTAHELWDLYNGFMWKGEGDEEERRDSGFSADQVERIGHEYNLERLSWIIDHDHGILDKISACSVPSYKDEFTFQDIARALTILYCRLSWTDFTGRERLYRFNEDDVKTMARMMQDGPYWGFWMTPQAGVFERDECLETIIGAVRDPRPLLRE